MPMVAISASGLLAARPMPLWRGRELEWHMERGLICRWSRGVGGLQAKAGGVLTGREKRVKLQG